MQKITFEEFQNHGSVMISLPRLQHRFQVTKEKLEAAGFKNISIVKGVDGFNDDIEPLLQTFGLEGKLAEEISGKKGKIACTLSHVLLWKKIVDEKIPWLLIFEDDALPHPEFRTLGPSWWEETPSDFDVVLLGNQMDIRDIRLYNGNKIVQSPAYCLHAYIVSYKGALRLLELLQQTGTMKMNDIQVCEWMALGLLDYYCWNGTGLQEKGYPVFHQRMDLADALKYETLIVERRDTGLIYQNFLLGHTLAQENTIFNVVIYDD
jgi:GR25 family glycosyltransferase involved in LPS biosynthesis